MLPLIMSCLCVVLGENPPETQVPWLEVSANKQIVRDGESLIIAAPETGEPSTTMLVEVIHPKIPSHEYMLKTRVRYDGVEGQAYFDMWNYFPDGGMYFSRNLGMSGPVGFLSGTSSEREVWLPFQSLPGKVPNRITVALVLPGKGKVVVEPFRLSAMPKQPDSSTLMMGVVVQAIVGLNVFFLGLLAVVPSLRRGLVPGLAVAFGIGVVMIVAGVVGWQQLSPMVTSSLVAGGIFLAILAAILIPIVRAWLRRVELRRMKAMDLV